MKSEENRKPGMVKKGNKNFRCKDIFPPKEPGSNKNLSLSNFISSNNIYILCYYSVLEHKKENCFSITYGDSIILIQFV